MTARNDGGAAFPTLDHNGHSLVCREFGMSLRDWIAGQCVASAFGTGGNEALWVADGETEDEALRRHWSGVVKAAFVAAGAFIAARPSATEGSDG